MKLIQKIKMSAKMLVLWGVLALFALVGSALYFYNAFTKEIPEITKVSDYRPLGVTQIISVEGKQTKMMAEFYKEKRYLTPYDQIPPKLVQAFISAEDSTFFEHQGVNVFAIMRAAIANFLAGQVVQGGSTITQQISKSLYLSPEKSIIRKIRELMVAFQLEKHLTKEEILYLYLNQIYLGSGAYGVQAAARTYFQKDLKQLTIAEMALIAGLPTAPGKYSPLLNPKKARERQLYVLKRMLDNKIITEAEQKSAVQEKIKIFVNDGTERHMAPHFVEYIRRHLIQKYGEKALYEDGLTVTLPAAAKYSLYAQEALETGLEEADQRKGYRGPIRKLDLKDVDSYLLELKKEVTKNYFPFRYLTTEGTLDLEQAIRDSDPTFSKALTGKNLKGVVTSVDNDKKFALVNVGITTVQVPFDQLKWAAPADAPNKLPKNVSDVLSVNDVVWVRMLNYALGVWKARLNQIPEIQGALYSVDVSTGQILAMVGGYDYETSEFNRAVQAKRQMGSTFKPVIYSAALEKGYTPASIIVDSPIVFEDKENGVWKPENFEEKFYGDTTFRQALINSRNIPTIKIVQDIKVQTVINQARRLGIDTPLNADLSIALGSSVATVQEMVHAFSAFPMQGREFHPVVFQNITDRDGRTLESGSDVDAKKNPEPATSPTEPTQENLAPYAPLLPGLRLDPRVAYVMTRLMNEVVQFGTAAKANVIGRPIAGKTGTTQDFRDGWFIGFSPKVVTGVWVGYDDQRTMGRGETGANTALPIWIKYMANVLKDYPMDDFVEPEGITTVSIDPKTGKLSTGARAIKEKFIAGTEPGAIKTQPAFEEGDEPDAEAAKPSSGKIEQTDEEVLREDE